MGVSITGPISIPPAPQSMPFEHLGQLLLVGRAQVECGTLQCVAKNLIEHTTIRCNTVCVLCVANKNHSWIFSQHHWATWSWHRSVSDKCLLLRVPILGLTRRLFRGDPNNSLVISFTTSLSDLVVTQKCFRQVCIITSPCVGVNKTTVWGSTRCLFWGLRVDFSLKTDRYDWQSAFLRG